MPSWRRRSRDGIDLLVDLAGHTVGNRLKLFALRPAAAQLSYLGYPFATGLAAIRYRVGDAVTDPDGGPQAPWEEVVRLPGCFCCYAPPRDVPLGESLPEARAGAVTFGSLHKLEKVNDRVLDVWGRLLQAVPGSRLLLAWHTLRGATAERLRRRFAERGIGSGRLLVESVESTGWRHLRVCDRIDLLLDVWPWCGHATGCEAPGWACRPSPWADAATPGA